MAASNSITANKPGTIITDNKTLFKVLTADGALNIKTMQMEGKKRMPVSDILRGLKLDENAFFC